MSRMIDLNFHPEQRTLRQFGWIALVGFSFLALFAWKDWAIFSFGLGAAKPVVAGSLLTLGAIAGLFSALYPQANRPIYVGLALITFPIGFVLSYLILGGLFYLLITPIGWIFRLGGRDLMQRRFAPDATTYWLDARRPPPAENYFRQF